MGWGNKEESQTPVYNPPAYIPPMYAGPSYNPYESLMGGEVGAGSLLGGNSNVPQVNSPGFIPTGGWAGTQNANMIPGAAMQLLRMAQSPFYTWR